MSAYQLNDTTISYIVSAIMEWRTSALSGPVLFALLRSTNAEAAAVALDPAPATFKRVASTDPTWVYSMCTNYQYQCCDSSVYASSGVRGIISATLRAAVEHDIVDVASAPDQLEVDALVPGGVHIMDEWGFNPTWELRDDSK